MKQFIVYQGDGGYTGKRDIYVSCSNQVSKKILIGECKKRDMIYRTHKKISVHSGGTCGHGFHSLICYPKI